MTCLPSTDVEDMDNESREMYEADVAGLHRYFSKHLELPEHRELLTLLSQVLQRTILPLLLLPPLLPLLLLLLPLLLLLLLLQRGARLSGCSESVSVYLIVTGCL